MWSVYTGNDRRTCDDCIVIRQAAVVNETTVYCKYIELRGGIYCYARLKYSNDSGAKTVWKCHGIYDTRTPEERRPEHRTRPQAEEIITNRNLWLARSRIFTV